MPQRIHKCHLPRSAHRAIAMRFGGMTPPLQGGHLHPAKLQLPPSSALLKRQICSSLQLAAGVSIGASAVVAGPCQSVYTGREKPRGVTAAKVEPPSSVSAPETYSRYINSFLIHAGPGLWGAVGAENGNCWQKCFLAKDSEQHHSDPPRCIHSYYTWAFNHWWRPASCR